MQKESQPKGDMRQCMYNDMNDFYNGSTGMLLSSTLKLASSVRVLLWSFRSNNGVFVPGLVLVHLSTWVKW